MRWYAIDWFGGVKVECPECHRYTTELTQEQSHTLLYQQTDDSCSTCQLERNLIDLNKENKKLKISVDAWKDAWHKMRDVCGWLWWHHPDISKESQMSVNKQIDVYVNEKLVGAGTTAEAVEAIKRLMSFSDKKAQSEHK